MLAVLLTDIALGDDRKEIGTWRNSSQRELSVRVRRYVGNLGEQASVYPCSWSDTRGTCPRLDIGIPTNEDDLSAGNKLVGAIPNNESFDDALLALLLGSRDRRDRKQHRENESHTEANPKRHLLLRI